MLLIPPLRNGHERTRTGISGHFGPYCGDRAITLVESQADQRVSECNGDFASLLGIGKLECVFSFDFHRNAVD
jgi:hypothetical protein